MAQPVSLAVALATALLAIGAASPLAAQSSRDQVRVVTTPEGRTVYVVPGDADKKTPKVRTLVTTEGRTVYIVDEKRKDTDTPRQRCVGEEVAAAGGSPSDLAWGAIDLKCSQR